MSQEAPDFGDIRSALQAEPSATAWRSLCALLERLPDGEYSSRVASYAHAHLRRWPDTMRVCPRRWLDRALDGRAPAALELVRVLELQRSGLTDEQLEPLASLPALDQIKRIDLSDNWLKARGAAALARAAHLTNVRSLTLDNNQIGDTGCAQLARAAGLRGLRTLGISRNDVTDAGFSTLVRSPTCSTLERLDASSNWLGAVAGEALERARLEHLTDLELAANSLGDEGMRALARSLDGVRRLDVRHNRLGWLGAQLVSWAPQAHTLERLDLSENPIKDQGLRFLAESSHLSALRALDLSQCALAGPGLEALVDTPHLGALEMLDLSHNAIGADGLALPGEGVLARIIELDLSRNPFGDEGVEVLTRHMTRAPWASLRALRLDACGIGDDGARMLASCPALASLEVLSLRHDPIGEAGASALAHSDYLPEHIRAPWRATLEDETR